MFILDREREIHRHRDREKERESVDEWGRGERKGDTDSEAGSRL